MEYWEWSTGMESLEWSHWNGEYWTGFHLGIHLGGKAHGSRGRKAMVDLIIMAYLGGGGGGGGGGELGGGGGRASPATPPPPPPPLR